MFPRPAFCGVMISGNKIQIKLCGIVDRSWLVLCKRPNLKLKWVKSFLMMVQFKKTPLQ
jgi:hypothetical protein